MLSASRSCPNTGSWKQTLAWLSRNRALLVTWNATPHAFRTRQKPTFGVTHRYRPKHHVKPRHREGRLPEAGFANSWRSTGPAVEQLPAPKVPSSHGAWRFPVNSSRCRPSRPPSSTFRWGSIADKAVSSAATPAATAASLATRFSFDVLGRMDFFDFVGRLVFVCLRVFDLAATRFELFFDLTRRFDEVLDLARFFAFFMISPVRFDLVQIGLQSYCWQAGVATARTTPSTAERLSYGELDARSSRLAHHLRTNLRSRPRARGLARRDARRFDHVTLTRGAAALAVATSTLAVPFHPEASSSHTTR